MNERVSLRRTRRSSPIFNKIDIIANAQPEGNNQFSKILLDILELGLKSYEAGNRLVLNEVVKKPSVFETGERSVYSVFNEVVETLYSSLAGGITNLIRYEEQKVNSNLNTINYYNMIGSALWLEKSEFYKLTDIEIKEVANILSPINKQLFGDKDKQQLVIEENKKFFDELITKWAEVIK